jgi:hypothetical protein
MHRMPAEAYRPSARQQGLLKTKVAGDMVVVDIARNRAMTLNPALALLWQLSNGKRTVSELAAVMGAQVGEQADASSVWFGLRKLERAHLLQESVPIPKRLEIGSRRHALKLLGLGAGALAVMTLPTPASAASCTFGNTCSTDADCANCGVNTKCCGLGTATCAPFGHKCCAPVGAC